MPNMMSNTGQLRAYLIVSSCQQEVGGVDLYHAMTIDLFGKIWPPVELTVNKELSRVQVVIVVLSTWR